MHQKVLTGTFVVVICVSFIFCAGCSSIKDGMPVPPTQTSVPSETQIVVVTPVITPLIRAEVTAGGTPFPHYDMVDHEIPLARDAAFDALFLKSAETITNKTVLVIQAMVPGTTGPQLTYSPTVLYLRAKDLGYTSENYYNQMLTIKADTPDNEAKRIAYIQFLYTAKNAAYNIANAAEAESYGDYQGALSYLKVAKIDLQNIREDPSLPPTTPYNILNTFLNEYIGRMQKNVIQQQNLAALGGSFNPTIQLVVSGGSRPD